MLISDSTRIVEHKVLEKIRIETPMGAIESDSGNHIMDGLTIVILILALYTGKKIVDRYFKKKCCCRR
tara:strand:+ start:15 stop:218 length:204 start_codon:yes stop_codon:yes gene_type:complete